MKQIKRYKDEKFASTISKFAAEYFGIEANKDSLITVTYTNILDRGKRAIVYFTTLPREKEKEALDFTKRRRRDFRQFIMNKKTFGFAPNINFEIDHGEYNRQRIDELSNEFSIETSLNKS